MGSDEEIAIAFLNLANGFGQVIEKTYVLFGVVGIGIVLFALVKTLLKRAL